MLILLKMNNIVVIFILCLFFLYLLFILLNFLSKNLFKGLLMSQKTSPSPFFRILSLDGGGVYTLRSLIILQYLEKKLQKPISQIFDLISGTSSGGLIALGLSIPKENTQEAAFDTKDLIHFYQKYGAEIFQNPYFFTKKYYWLRFIEKLFFAKYTNEGSNNVFKTVFRPTSRLSDLLTSILIPACQVKPGQFHPFLFSSFHARIDWKQNFLNYQVAMSTSAAPILFPSYVLKTPTNEKLSMADGALIANNPVFFAYLHGRMLCPDRPLLIVSIGTNFTSLPLKWDLSRLKYGSGFLKWALCIKDLIILNQNIPQYFIKKALSENDFYMRVEMPFVPFPFDDYSASHFQYLTETAENYIKNNQQALDDLVDKLS